LISWGNHTGEEMWSEVHIGSKDMTWLFTVPFNTFSVIIHGTWNSNEVGHSPSIIVTSNIPMMLSIK
jgi:hypothetical protein